MKKEVKKKTGSNELDEKKTKYFVIAIVLLILLSVLLIVHFNNKEVVSGDEEVKTTTTTTTTKKVKTTKKIKKQQAVKEEEKEEVEETPVYKSTVDEKNKLVYNYILTDEITETDIIVSEALEIKDELKNNNVVLLYDISLFDANLVKKNVKNSKIDISIPLSKELLEFDELKVVYIDDNDQISDEKFESVIEDGYIKFSTTHLSKFGIIGTKKDVAIAPEEELDKPVDEEINIPTDEEVELPEEEIDTPVEEETIDLSKANVGVKINGELIEDYTNLLVQTTDNIELVINGLEDLEEEYKVYYLLRKDGETAEYKEYTPDMLSGVKTAGKYTLIIKINTVELEQIFEMGIYDFVFKYDQNAELEEDFVYPEISEGEEESDYTNPEENKNIVIDNITKESEEEPEVSEPTEGEDNVEESEPEEGTEIEGENPAVEEGTTPGENEGIVPDEGEEDLSDKATISLKGNVYLIEKTDISELEITGHLIIDTDEDIVYDKEKLENIYSITIKSKEFSLNGVKYTYEYTKDGLVISKVEVVEGEEETDIFEGYEYDNTKEELVFTKKEEVVPDEGNDNQETIPEVGDNNNQEIPEDEITPEVAE